MVRIGLQAYINELMNDPTESPQGKLFLIHEVSEAARLAAEFAAKDGVGYDPEEQTFPQLVQAIVKFIHHRPIDLLFINWEGISFD